MNPPIFVLSNGRRIQEGVPDRYVDVSNKFVMPKSMLRVGGGRKLTTLYNPLDKPEGWPSSEKWPLPTGIYVKSILEMDPPIFVLSNGRRIQETRL
jgi:hypothetical protein